MDWENSHIGLLLRISGDYDVSFRDTKGYVGVKTFKVVPAITPVPDRSAHNRAPSHPPTTLSCILPWERHSPLFPRLQV